MVLNWLIIPVIIFIFSRTTASHANYYLNAKRKQNGRIGFIKMNFIRYILISVFCKESDVASRVLIMSILSILNCGLIIASILLWFFYGSFWWIGFVVCCCLAGGLLLIMNLFANYRDKTIWIGPGFHR